MEDGKTVLRAAPTEVNPFEEFAGCLPAFRNVDEIHAWVREMRDPDGEYGLRIESPVLT